MSNASLKMQAPGTGGRVQVSSPQIQPQVAPANLQPGQQAVVLPEEAPLSMHSPLDFVPDPVPQVPAMPLVSSAPVSVAPVSQVVEEGGSSVPVVPAQQIVAGSGGSDLVDVTAPTPAPLAPTQPSQPSPSAVPHKEGAPVGVAAAESSKPVEIMQPSMPEVVVAPELKEVLAPAPQAKPVVLDAAVKQAGVALTGDAATVVKTPTGSVKLPMSYAEAVAIEKRTKFRDAWHWFARYIEYQWRKLDPTIGG